MGVRGSAIVNVIDHIKLNIKSNFLSIYYLLEESKKKKKKKKKGKKKQWSISFSIFGDIHRKRLLLVMQNQ
jgi:hypothetical protein